MPPTPKELRQKIEKEKLEIQHLNQVIALRERKVFLLKELARVTEELILILSDRALGASSPAPLSEPPASSADTPSSSIPAIPIPPSSPASSAISKGTLPDISGTWSWEVEDDPA